MTTTVPQYHKQLRSLDPTEFERFIAELWERRGWETELTTSSGDGGIDVVATKNQPVPEKWLIQAKCYGNGNTVGAPEVREYHSLNRTNPDADLTLVVTTSSFTTPAKQTASSLDVKLVDGPQLSQIIEDADAGDLVIDYTSGDTPTSDSPSPEPDTTSRTNSTDQPTDEEMDVIDALLAVIQMLLVLGVLGYVVFYIVTTVLV